MKVKVTGAGLKLAGKWHFIDEIVEINKEEYERNKDYVEVVEENNNQNPEGNQNSNEDEELEKLIEQAKGLGIRNVRNMKKETLIAKIKETEKAGNNQNPEGE